MTDDSSVFPIYERGPQGMDLVTTGLSVRALFAAILMHSEAVTCGVPGEACDALVQAADAVGQDAIDHMASNAVVGADALLRALSGPALPEHRELAPSEKFLLEAAEEGRAALYALRSSPAFEDLPADLREQVAKAVATFEDAEIPF